MLDIKPLDAGHGPVDAGHLDAGQDFGLPTGWNQGRKLVDFYDTPWDRSQDVY